jgi:hypothetical protein
MGNVLQKMTIGSEEVGNQLLLILNILNVGFLRTEPRVSRTGRCSVNHIMLSYRHNSAGVDCALLRI